MINKDNVKELTDIELKLCHNEHMRRIRGGKQEVRPEGTLDIY